MWVLNKCVKFNQLMIILLQEIAFACSCMSQFGLSSIVFVESYHYLAFNFILTYKVLRMTFLKEIWQIKFFKMYKFEVQTKQLISSSVVRGAGAYGPGPQGMMAPKGRKFSLRWNCLWFPLSCNCLCKHPELQTSVPVHIND